MLREAAAELRQQLVGIGLAMVALELGQSFQPFFRWLVFKPAPNRRAWRGLGGRFRHHGG
jgi:hypothetical protein